MEGEKNVETRFEGNYYDNHYTDKEYSMKNQAEQTKLQAHIL